MANCIIALEHCMLIPKTLYNDRLTDLTIQMRVIHCVVLSPFNGSWNYPFASVSSYKTSDNFTTLASK